MRRALVPLSLFTSLLLAGCAGGFGEPETVEVTVTSVVDAPVDDSNEHTPPEPEPEPASEPEEPEAPAAPQAGALALDPVHKGQVGGTCGITPEGAKISVNDTTSCDLAAAAYPIARHATYTWTNTPNVTSVPFTNISGVYSPVTGGSYDLRCTVGSDGTSLSCSGPNNDPLMSYTLSGSTWHSLINIVG
ncbi:hypothetical protein [Corynebacterium lujinxingii]|uniref:Ig-like domain-containing protein n=1 Tax=Corynebacterium lujinxingii TaxID=2763010 RepID=A0A7H0JYM9_9CORY|nr:hypothetical protein [Corynebacterium lujinxingii]MBC3179697.1 hypothetical protein [Corynebacterium lujinxingii]NNO11625.1 hypothetical protein [Corynebacterium lujinxingii]QNP90145.1 hypothetical protein IAU68_10945 [Corynebacterium lujinxingii]